MKVRIKGHSSSIVAPWWYAKHIGKTFEAAPDEQKPEYFYTMIEVRGKLQKHHIKVIDCNIVA